MSCTETSDTRTRTICDQGVEYKLEEKKYICDDGNGPYVEWREVSRTATGSNC